MGKINVLDKHVAELIAAGEVVERPASVIKELVENSIDAGATSITIEIKNGGVTFMRVADNGSGILKDDIRVAFIRHATSKVLDENDLNNISTLGFRGEALASISSVSHLELITKACDEDTGTRYVVSGGEEVSFDEAGCPNGTTFIIRDLFYNVPARAKFLKTDLSEGNAVSNVVDKIALSHPEVSITYIKDSKQMLKTSGDGKLMSAIYAVYGREFASGLIPVEYTLDGVRVSGYISKPEFARPNRNMQNFFINNRFVICKTAMAALSEASKGSVMVGKFLSCVLNIELSFEAVDVNVHPTKLEVRFVNEKPIFNAVYHAVKTALLNKDTRIQASFANKKSAVNPFKLAKKAFREIDIDDKDKNLQSTQVNKENIEKSVQQVPKAQNISVAQKDSTPKTADELFAMLDSDTKSDQKQTQDKGKSVNLNLNLSDYSEPVLYKSDSDKKAVFSVAESDESIAENKQNNINPAFQETLIDVDENYYQFIGEAFKTYIIIEKNKDELLILDKHAAHERILFEKLKKEKGVGYSQMLLDPITVLLDKIDYNSVITNLDVFSDTGFEVEDFGTGSVIVRSAPQFLSFDDIEPTVIEMASYLTENRKDIRSEKMEWIYHNIACRAAIKAGNKSTEKELIDIAKRVENEDIRYCPHGRPVCIVMKKRELEKQFGRV